MTNRAGKTHLSDKGALSMGIDSVSRTEVYRKNGCGVSHFFRGRRGSVLVGLGRARGNAGRSRTARMGL